MENSNSNRFDYIKIKNEEGSNPQMNIFDNITIILMLYYGQIIGYI